MYRDVCVSANETFPGDRVAIQWTDYFVVRLTIESTTSPALVARIERSVSLSCIGHILISTFVQFVM